MFRRRNQHEEAQEEKGSQEEPGVVPWQEGAFKLLILELVYIGIPLLVLRLINKVLARSA
jgi:hypothetical protein